MAYGPSPDDYSMTPGHDWWTDNAPGPDGMPTPDAPAPPAAPAAAAAAQPQGPQYGGAYQQIADFFRKYTGRDPSQAEVQQWGGNIDANYLRKIENTILQQGVQSGYWDPQRNAPKAAAAAPGAASGSSTAGASDPEGFRKAWYDSGGKNVTDLAAFVKAHPEYGATITGSKGSKIQFGNGQSFQAVRSAGINGGIGPAWDDLSAPNNGRAPDLLSPFPENFTSTPFQAPAPFTAPTADQAFNDQGFQFTLKQGQDALEKSAAAHGTLLTTGTLKDLDQFSQGLASTQYDKVYNRDLGQYESNYGHAQTNYLQDRGNALQEYGIRHDLYNESQDRPYGKLMGLANLGAGMPGSGAYAAGASGTLTGIGNAQAASGLYGANAYQNAYGGLANLGGYYAGQYMNRGNSYSPYGYGYGFGPIPPPQGPGY